MTIKTKHTAAAMLALAASAALLSPLARAQTITHVAGTALSGHSGDGGPAGSAQVNSPQAMAFDRAGNLYIADQSNQRIRKVTADSSGNVSASSTISTIAGDGTAGFAGDGGPAASAQMRFPMGIALDSRDNVYFADRDNHRIRRIDAATGHITTVIGNGASSNTGDGSAAASASVATPYAVAIDRADNLFILTRGTDQHAVRRIDAATGIVTTVVSATGIAGFGGDGGPASDALLGNPWTMQFDRLGNLYIADASNTRVRRVAAGGSGLIDGSSTISTVLGTGTAGFTADGQLATSTAIDWAAGLAFSNNNDLYYADANNRRIRTVNAANQRVATIGGTGASAGVAGNDGPAASAVIRAPRGLAVDRRGNLFLINDSNSIRKITWFTGAISPSAPRNLAATPGNGQASFSFDAPQADGGAAITEYAVQCTGGVHGSGGASPVVVSGMANGTAYTCYAFARNSAGEGLHTAPLSVTPSGVPQPVPSAPQDLAAAAGYEQIRLSFNPPASGAAPTGYAATCQGGGSTHTETAASAPIDVTGLANGTPYACTVYAQSLAGNGAVAGPVHATPQGISYVPQGVTATPGNGSATIGFAPPLTGTPMRYQLTCQPGSISRESAAATPFVLTGLANGTTYTCLLRADYGTHFGDVEFSFTPTASTTPSVTPVPTLGHAALALLGALVGGLGLRSQRRKQS